MNEFNDHADAATDLLQVGLSSAESSTGSGGGVALRSLPADSKFSPVRMSRRESRVMVADQQPNVVSFLTSSLATAGFENASGTTELAALCQLARQQRPNLILLDVAAADNIAIDAWQALRDDQELSNVPVVALISSANCQTMRRAIEWGAVDLLTKPIDANELVVRVANVLELKAHRDQLDQYSEQMEHQVRLRTRELERSRQEAIHCLARAGEYRDDDTGHHVTRVGRYSAIIARELGFPRDAVELIEQAAQLHDVGKIGIPDAILHKPAKLDPQEFDIVREHCSIGRRIINPLSHEESIRLKQHTSVGMQIMGSASSPVLKLAALIASTHHEKWDGSGYPQGLSHNAIPIEGRIVAVADVFDALSSARPYKDAFPLEKCFQILEEGRGSHFDPQILDAFFDRQADVIEIFEQFGDASTDSVDLLGAELLSN